MDTNIELLVKAFYDAHIAAKENTSLMAKDSSDATQKICVDRMKTLDATKRALLDACVDQPEDPFPNAPGLAPPQLPAVPKRDLHPVLFDWCYAHLLMSMGACGCAYCWLSSIRKDNGHEVCQALIDLFFDTEDRFITWVETNKIGEKVIV